MAAGNPKLHQPLVVQLEGCHQACVGKRINRIEQRVAENVVVWRQLGLDPRDGNETAQPQVQAVDNLRKVEIDVFQGGIKAILTVIVEQLAAEIPLCQREAIVRSNERGEMVAPVDMIALHGIRQALGVKDKLVQLKTIRVGVIRLRCIAVCGSGEV